MAYSKAKLKSNDFAEYRQKVFITWTWTHNLRMRLGTLCFV